MTVIIVAENHIRPFLQDARFDVADKVLSGKGTLFRKCRVKVRSVGLHKPRLRDHPLSVIGIVEMPSVITVAVAEKDDVFLRHAHLMHGPDCLADSRLPREIQIPVRDEHNLHRTAVTKICLKKTAEKIQLIVLMGHNHHHLFPGEEGFFPILRHRIGRLPAEVKPDPPARGSDEQKDGKKACKYFPGSFHIRVFTGFAVQAKGYSFAKAAQAFFALSSSVKIPNTADPVPVITAPTAPLFISLFLISAMGFIRLSDTSSNTLYIRLHTCARFPSFMASRIPAVSG